MLLVNLADAVGQLGALGRHGGNTRAILQQHHLAWAL